MSALKPVLILAVLIQVLAALLSQHSTGATLTDTSGSTANAFATRSLQAPALTAEAGGPTANLSWTNPDALTGPGASFIVQRASGDCAAPGAFTGLSGSPFASTVLATTETPGANATYCYSVQSALHSWRSPVATASVTLRAAAVPKLRLLAASPGVCGAGRSLSAATAAANLVIPGRTSVTFAAPPAEALTTIPAGPHVATLVFPGSGGAASTVTYSVELGLCTDAGFEALANATDSFTLGRADETRTVHLEVAAARSLDATSYLAVRVSNSGSSNVRLTGNNAESTLEAPAGSGY